MGGLGQLESVPIAAGIARFALLASAIYLWVDEHWLDFDIRILIPALLIALLEPTRQLQQYEAEGDYTSRLALMEECKTLPFAAVWDYYCLRSNVPIGKAWIDSVKQYETDVLVKR